MKKAIDFTVSVIRDVNEIELLDSLADQIVTAIGVAHMMGFDILGALQEVNRSNFSKFEDGKAVFDENGKIRKGKDYTPPNLESFV
jgi:predicted HAD superfamily Cof-like phosphohydrolase